MAGKMIADIKYIQEEYKESFEIELKKAVDALQHKGLEVELHHQVAKNQYGTTITAIVLGRE